MNLNKIHQVPYQAIFLVADGLIREKKVPIVEWCVSQLVTVAYCPHAWSFNLRTRTYLIFWSALFIGVVLVVVLVGCSDGFTEGEIQEKVEEAVGTAMSDLSLAPTPLPPTGRIAFTSDRDENDEIYVMDADGSNQTRLTSNSVEASYPNWGPAR